MAQSCGTKARGALAIFVLILTGCDFDLPAPPPAAPVDMPPASSALSTISVPLIVDVERLKSSVINELRSKPLFQGKTPELNAKLLTEEKTILQQPRKVVDVPYKAAECITKKIPRQITRHVKVPAQ